MAHGAGKEEAVGNRVILVPLPPENIEEAWPLVEPYASQMAERFPDDWPEPEIKRAAVEREITLWLVWEPATKEHFALAATCVARKPSGKRVLVIELCVGRESERWVHLIADLEKFGRDNGCVQVELRGRSGWARRLPEYVLTKGEPVLSKAL